MTILRLHSPLDSISSSTKVFKLTGPISDRVRVECPDPFSNAEGRKERERNIRYPSFHHHHQPPFSLQFPLSTNSQDPSLPRARTAPPRLLGFIMLYNCYFHRAKCGLAQWRGAITNPMAPRPIATRNSCSSLRIPAASLASIAADTDRGRRSVGRCPSREGERERAMIKQERVFAKWQRGKGGRLRQ